MLCNKSFKRTKAGSDYLALRRSLPGAANWEYQIVTCLWAILRILHLLYLVVWCLPSGGKLELLFDLLSSCTHSYSSLLLVLRNTPFIPEVMISIPKKLTVPSSSSKRIWCELLRDILKLTLIKYAKYLKFTILVKYIVMKSGF